MDHNVTTADLILNTAGPACTNEAIQVRGCSIDDICERSEAERASALGLVFSWFWLVIRCGGPLRSLMFNVVRCGISSYPSTIVGAIDQIEIIECLRFQSS